jgi:ABC-type dipeptide/oligopeptide/nickel transport system ATPase component
VDGVNLELKSDRAVVILGESGCGKSSLAKAILRLLLEETDIKRLFEPPDSYNPAEQGDWDEKLITFGPKRTIKLESMERKPTRLELVYNFGDLGWWEFVIESEKVSIARI